MSDLQKCPECPWTGYGLPIHIGVMHSSVMKKRAHARRIEQIATLLEHTEDITMQEVNRLALILLDVADTMEERRQKELEEQERMYNELRERLLPRVGGSK